jgi:hypothetical protein
VSAATFVRGPLTPMLAGEALGLLVAIEERSAHGKLLAFRVHGAYRVSVDDARAVGVTPLQRALVAVVASGRVHAALRLIGDAVVFPDDEHVGGGVVSGCFSADLLGRVALPPYARGNVVVALGPLLSNVVSFSAQ